MKLPAPALILLLLTGCQSNLWWEYRDDPYIASVSDQGNAEVMRNVNSSGAAERQMALRIVAHQAAEARRQDRMDEVDRLEMVILRRYFVEKDAAVKACIVRICAPAVGRGSTRMVKFLRDRIAAGEFPGYAAMSLAALAPRDAYVDIEPLTRHPAPEVRLRAAVALTVLRDPRGFDAVKRVWRGMDGGTWPERIDGVPLFEAKRSLELHAQRSFGRPLY